jgi:hypothetical protein
LRLLATAAVIALLPTAFGCHLQLSTDVVYKPALAKEPTAPRAAKRNELTAGVLPLVVRGENGAEPAEDDARAKEVGRALADALEDAQIFKDVRYPLRDEQVDVVLEPVLTVSLAKNRLTNAVTVFPGIVFPWIDGFGFDYDHTAVLEITVRDGAHRDTWCDRHVERSAMTAERYPSVLWWVGLHAGLLILLVFESATTDTAVLDRLIERDCGRVIGPSIAWIGREFAPEAKKCPDHPDAPVAGKYCVYCRRNLWYPILDRREGRPRPPAGAAPPGSALGPSAPGAARAVTETAR